MGQEAASLALFLALCCFVPAGSSLSAAGRRRAGAPLTCKDERWRMLLDDSRALAKVGVAGSNPVVRSTKQAGQGAV